MQVPACHINIRMFLPILMQDTGGIVRGQISPYGQFVVTVGYARKSKGVFLFFTFRRDDRRLSDQCSGRCIVQGVIESSRISPERQIFVYLAQLWKLRYIQIVLVLNRYPNRVRLFYRTFVSARGSKYHANYHAEDLYYSSIHNL